MYTHEVLQQLGTLHSLQEAKFWPTTHSMGQPANGLPIRVPRRVIILGSALSVRAQPAQLLTGGDGTGAKCGNLSEHFKSRIGWSRPPRSRPPQVGPARPAATDRRWAERLGQSLGPAGPKPGPARRDLRAHEGKKGEGRFAGETGSTRQGCAGVAGARPKIEEASDGLQDSSMAQPRGETNQEY